MNPDHLRAAIEKIGIEKPSDYTLVLEEVERMEKQTLADLQREAWEVGASGDRRKIIEWGSRSFLHSQIMSGRVKFGERPPPEEVGRMEAEEKIVDQSREALLFAALEDAWAENNMQGGMGVEQARIHARVRIDMAKRQMRHIPPDCSALLTASEAFIREAEEMGWGKTSDKALPGSFDLLLKAVREVKR